MSNITFQYPDVYDNNGNELDNQARARLYVAVLYLLSKEWPKYNIGSFIKEIPGGRPGDSIGVEVHIGPNGLGSTSPESHGQLQETRRFILAVYGGMLAENVSDPALARSHMGPYGQNEIVLTQAGSAGTKLAIGTDRIRIVPRFRQVLAEVVGNYTVNQELFDKVLAYLEDAGMTQMISPGARGLAEDIREAFSNEIVISNVFSKQLYDVVQKLVRAGVGPNHPQIKLKIAAAVGDTVGSECSNAWNPCGGAGFSGHDLDLPDLTGELSAEIYADNVNAMAILYFSAQLEEMRLFQVADEVAQQFQYGLMPITRGAGADNIFEYIKCAPTRFTEVERRSLYARAFGMAGGGLEVPMPNTDFQNLWFRALSAISAYNQQSPAAISQDYQTYGNHQQCIAVNVGEGWRINQMQVFKSTRELAVNLSLHGFAMAHYAAVELQHTIKKIRAMLSHPDVLSTYGVRDYTQLIERVASMYLGSKVNTLSGRQLADSGARIIRWISRHSEVLSQPGLKDSRLFTERELVNNVEAWLAATGTGGAMIERYAEPSPTSAQPTIPNVIDFRMMSKSMDRAVDELDKAIHHPGIHS